MNAKDKKVENWLDIARKKLRKIENDTPKKIMKNRILKKENLTPGSSHKKKKISVGERKSSKVDEMKKLWETSDINTRMQKIKSKKKIIDKIEPGISSQKVGKLLTSIDNSVKILGSQKKSNKFSAYSQPRIDAWIHRNEEFGNQTRAKELD